MSSQHERPPSHLFAVRLWREDLGDGQAEWRGQAIYMPSDETLFFRDMAELADFMRRFITPAAPVNDEHFSESDDRTIIPDRPRDVEPIGCQS